jgi:hypothetical protein
MATAHIRLLLYDMTYLGTKQWRESTQCHPTIPSILMIDNEATVQIACNGKLTLKTRHIKQRFHYVRQGQQDGTHQLHWIPRESQLADIIKKHKSPPRLIFTLTKSFVLSLITCYNLLTTQQRFDLRGVLDIQYRPM